MNTFKTSVFLTVLLTTFAISGSAQQSIDADRLHLMDRALHAMIELNSVQRLERPVAVDTTGFGAMMASKHEWQRTGGPARMRGLADRLRLPVDGSADPRGKVLVLVGTPQIEGGEAKIPAVVTFRVRDLETGELVKHVCMHHYDVRFTRETAGWQYQGASRAITACRGVLEQRRDWVATGS